MVAVLNMSLGGSLTSLDNIPTTVAPSKDPRQRSSLPATASQPWLVVDYRKNEPNRKRKLSHQKLGRNASGRSVQPSIPSISEIEAAEPGVHNTVMLHARNSTSTKTALEGGQLNGSFTGPHQGRYPDTAASSSRGSLSSLPVIQEQYCDCTCARFSRRERLLLLAVTLLGLVIVGLAISVGILSQNHPDTPGAGAGSNNIFPWF